ncbi:MAG: hypothetical protein CMM87_01835 [Rickettsiales bacterium]|nr:hypothetical protein [Rickettsiales bacterium]|tara:strand:- start:3375 stop:4595 length:1221 start_codon:yes stop_codon:yes gene_type:complete
MHRYSVGFSLFGVIVEYFDYALYGFLATEITAHFFPAHSLQNGLINTFAIFAMGSLAKPLGSFVFSHISDHKGRAYVVRIGVWGLMLSTLGIGLIPSYHVWGLWSLVGLILCRVTQGAVIGGQTDGIRLLVSEHIGSKFKHLSHGVMGAASGFGIYLAAYAAGKLHTSVNFDWQNLYLVGAFACFILVIMRHWIKDSTAFVQAKKKSAPHETIHVFLRNKRLLAVVILAMGSHGGLYHFFAIFLNTYTTDMNNFFTQMQGAEISKLVSLGYLIGGVAIGAAVDLLKHARLWLVTIFGLIVCCFMLPVLLFIHEFSTIVFFAAGFFLSGTSSMIIVNILASLPIRSRHRFFGFGHVIGSLMLSGTTPLIATKLFSVNEHLPMYWLGFLLAVNVGSTYALYRQQRKKI